MINESPLVSVVIPTYSRPVTLARAVNSVLGQTYQNIEVIVVDDNDPSSDARTETSEIMKQYESDSRVVYLKQPENRGGSSARNAGWRYSSADYITFLDDDDEYSPDRIEKMVSCMESLDDSWGMCYTAYRLIREDGSVQISSEKSRGSMHAEALMRSLFMGSGSNLLLRKSVVDEIGGYDERFIRNQDLEFLARVTENYKIEFIDEQLLTIRRDGARTSRPYGFFVGVYNLYLDTFRSRIDALPSSSRRRVYDVIALERCRCALKYKKFGEAYRILVGEKVSFIRLIKYLFYIIHRAVTHKSYGFKG